MEIIDDINNMSIHLRDYQEQALETVINEFQNGTNRQLIVLPTGSGKTLVMAAIAKHFNKRTLILAHREELISQAFDKIKLFWPDVRIGVCMAERDEINQQIVVGSVQSCFRSKRLEKLKKEGLELLMIDESHHVIADSYQFIIQELGFNKGSDKLLIGVTATPHRSDKHGLGDTFDKIVYSRSISTMIKAGYLNPVSGRKILTNFALRRIQTSNGDFSISDLSEAINTPERNAFIAEKIKEYAFDRKGVAFCADVQHCHDLANAFRQHGIKAEAVWGDMSGDDRKRVLYDLKTGQLQFVTSCGILTEGFDEPSISAIVMARPTKSQSLYIQSAGRGLRLWPGKQDCLILDFTDSGLNLDSVMTLSHTIPEAKIYEDSEPVNQHKEEVDRTSKIQVMTECDKTFDILGSTRFIWIPIGDDEWSMIDDDRHEIVMQPQDGGYVSELYLTDGSSQSIVESPLPLEYCSGISEDYARRHLKISFASTNASWMTQDAPATASQREYLLRKDAFQEGMKKSQAALEIRKIIALQNKNRRHLAQEPPTDQQRYFLANHGINPAKMSKLEAIHVISKLKKSA